MAGIFSRSKRRSAPPEPRTPDATTPSGPDESAVAAILAVEAAVAEAAVADAAAGAAVADAAVGITAAHRGDTSAYVPPTVADVVSPLPDPVWSADTVEIPALTAPTQAAMPAGDTATAEGGATAERAAGVARPWGFGREMLRVLATAYLSAYASLMVWSMVPMVAGWTPAVVISGSMEPSIRVGDVVFYAKEEPHAIAPGRVILVDDPNQPGRLLSHRLYERKDDGTLITKGDANAGPDSAPIRPDQVHGAARLVIPYVGKVTLWQPGNRNDAILWSAVTGLALLFARTPSPVRRGRHTAGGRRPSSA